MPAVVPYEPLNTLKPVARDVWIVDGPTIRMDYVGGLRIPFPTRMTVIRLSDGGLLCHSPTEWIESLGHELEALGPVAHLIAPNRIHYAWVPDWQARYPDARAWGAPGARDRAAAHGSTLAFDRELGDEAPPAWRDDLEQLRFRGSRFMDEIVFFHRASRTLVLTDLIENFERERLRGPWKWLMRLSGACHPDGKAPIDLRLTFVGRKREARAGVERMLSWAPERVILAHGRWYRENGTEELKRAFRWLL